MSGALGNRMLRKLKRLAARGGMSIVDVTLEWNERGALPPGYNPKVQGSGGAAPTLTPQTSDPIKAFFHTVSVGTTGYQKFSQVEKGDVILDFIGDVDLSGKPDLVLVVDGKRYVQKDGGEELARTMDAYVDGVAIVRSVLVRPIGGS